MEQKIESLEQFENKAQEFARGLRPRAHEATLITLSGELGAGKTAFVKATAKALGVEDVVNSPTFVLEKIYALSDQPFKRLIHIDAYRLESGAGLAPLRFDELMKDPHTLVMLEWPEKVADGLPQAAVSISIQGEGNARTITYG